ncbi:MAG TPA: Ig-like domain-containing protein [Streptosporangiaceae bacterium]
MRSSNGRARGRYGRFTRTRRQLAVPAAAATLILLTATACSGGGKPASTAGKHKPAAPAAAAAAAQLSISPDNGAKNAAPDRGITVRVANGKIGHVTVTAHGDPVTGVLTHSGTVWRSQWALSVDKQYTVTATATNSAGKTVTATSSFRTLNPSRTFRTMILESSHQTYGVGMPILLQFDHPIAKRFRAGIERSLQITTSKPVVGAWYWDDRCGVAPTCLYFRPRAYWPAHTKVSFTGHLNGVEGAPGVYGDHTLTQSFSIGRSLIVTASTSNHHMQLYRNGHMIDHWPISTGRPGDNTPNGTYLTIDKGNPVDMVGPGYNLEVPWSVRITWSGDYLHDAYWSVGEQGFTNVSHGCVNMPPAAAEAYYKMEVPGDPVTITGSPRAGTWGNGWTQWFLSWKQLVAGSALHEAVQADPHGSTFIAPSSVPPSHAKAPLETANWGNAQAT